MGRDGERWGEMGRDGERWGGRMSSRTRSFGRFSVIWYSIEAYPFERDFIWSKKSVMTC